MSHIALIFGGPSAEHEVSLVSAKNIFQVLKEAQIKVTLLGVTKDQQWKIIPEDDLLRTDFINPIDLNDLGIPIQLTNIDGSCFLTSLSPDSEKVGPIDIAFPIIHGTYGEDGQLQNDLQKIGLEYIGSESIGCENSFDKDKTKNILNKHGIKQVPFITFTDQNPPFQSIVDKLGLPFFIKPARMGSSVGISKVSSEQEYLPALAEARIHDSKIVTEQAVVAREIECALLENDELSVSGLGEVRPNHEFYSYEAKYLDQNGAELIIPAVVNPEITKEIQNLALDCFKHLGCRDYARADFFLTENNEIFFNEINTHPGFTNISQFPLLWQQEGLSYKELILSLVNGALKRRDLN